MDLSPNNNKILFKLDHSITDDIKEKKKFKYCNKCKIGIIQYEENSTIYKCQQCPIIKILNISH